MLQPIRRKPARVLLAGILCLSLAAIVAGQDKTAPPASKLPPKVVPKTDPKTTPKVDPKVTPKVEPKSDPPKSDPKTPATTPQKTEPAAAEGGVPKYISLRKLPGAITLATLSNGLTVIVQENHVAPVATVRCFVKNTGSAYEGRYLGAGLSHVLEHVVAGGTTIKRTEKEVSRIIDTFGGATNAYTTTDMTVYFVDCPAQHALTCIELVADSMQHITFEPNEFARELKVVNRELADGEVDRGRVQWKLLSHSIYTEHPARHPTIGYQEVLNATTNQTIIDFYRERYIPNNQTMVVVGDVNTKEVLDQIAREWTGTQRRTETQVVLGEEPLQLSPRETTVEMDGSTYDLVFAWPSINLQHPDLYALDLAAYILAEGESSRMTQRLKYELGLVQSVSSASFTPHYANGFFAIFSKAQPDKWEEASKEILNDVYRLKTERVKPAELAKAKKQKSAEQIFGRQTVQQAAESLGRSYLSTGDPLFDQFYVESIQKVTAEQIQDVANKYFDPARLNKIVVAPLPNPLSELDTDRDGKLGDEEVAAAFKKLDANADGKLSADEIPKKFIPQLGAGLPRFDENRDRAFSAAEFAALAATVVLPAPKAVAENSGAKESAVERHTLENGLKVLIKRVPHLPLVNMQAYALGATLVESDDKSGLASLTAAMLDQGTKTQTAEQIAEYIDSIGGQLSMNAGRNSLYGSVTTLREDFPKAGALFAECITQPAFPDEQFEKIKQLQLGGIAQRADNPQQELFELFYDSLPKTTPYHLIQDGKAETVAKLTPADCRAYHQKYFVPQNMIVTVFGDIDPAEALALVKRSFGSMKAQPDFKPIEPGKGNGISAPIVKHKQIQKPTGMVLLAFPSVSIYDREDYAALILLDAIMSGYSYPGGWLHTELRGEGLVYGVHAFQITGPAPGYFTIMAQTRPEAVEEVVRRIQSNIERARSGKIPEEDFETAMQMVTALHAQENTSISSQAQQAALDELYGLGYDYDKSYDSRIRAVTLAEVIRVAKKYLKDSILVTASPGERPVAGTE